MAKFYGNVGFAENVLEKPGKTVTQITERPYYGDIVKDYKKDVQSDKINDDISLGNNISIVCDPYAIQNFHKIKYVDFMGTKWKVTSVENQYPRLLLQMGSVYNENRKG